MVFTNDTKLLSYSPSDNTEDVTCYTKIKFGLLHREVRCKECRYPRSDDIDEVIRESDDGRGAKFAIKTVL